MVNSFDSSVHNNHFHIRIWGTWMQSSKSLFSMSYCAILAMISREVSNIKIKAEEIFQMTYQYVAAPCLELLRKRKQFRTSWKEKLYKVLPKTLTARLSN